MGRSPQSIAEDLEFRADNGETDLGSCTTSRTVVRISGRRRGNAPTVFPWRRIDQESQRERPVWYWAGSSHACLWSFAVSTVQGQKNTGDSKADCASKVHYASTLDLATDRRRTRSELSSLNQQCEASIMKPHINLRAITGRWWPSLFLISFQNFYFITQNRRRFKI